MKPLFLFFYILVFPSCAFLGKYIQPVSPVKTAVTSKKQTKSQTKNQQTKSALKKKKKQSVEQQIITQAKNHLRSSPLTQRQITKLKTILKSKKRKGLKDPVRMLLGRHFFRKSLYKKALFYYKKVQQNPHRKKALLWSAKLYHRLDQPQKALKTIDLMIEEESLSDRFLKEVYLLKLTILSQAPSPSLTKLFESYCHILTLEPKNKALYRSKAKNILFQMRDKSVLAIAGEDFITPLKDLVFFRQGEILLEREKFRRAHSFFKKFLRVAQDSALETQALKYIQAIESRKKVQRTHIGFIAPLTGPSARIGKRSVQGLALGLGLYNKQEKSPFKLIAIDSQGQADKVKKAVHTLVTKHHVIAIVGGVLSRTAPTLAKEAQNFAVPAVLMSQKSALTQAGPYIFQNGLTARQVTEQLIRFLMENLKARRFALLYPNDPYGVDYANAFWSAVENNGGQITGAQFYKPGETDFNGPIRRLTGLYYLTDRTEEYTENLKEWYLKKAPKGRRGHVPVENILSPILDFDVLFVPDSLKALGLIAPHLAYNDIKNISLAGPSLWNNQKLLKKYSKYATQIIFAELGIQSPAFKQTEFYREFFKNFNRKPGLFELQAYESALALRQVILSGADDRGELKDDMAKLKKFHGPMGEMAISKERAFSRPLKMLTIEKPKSH